MTTVATIIMGCLRVLFWLSAHYNLHITAHSIRGLANTVADNISRIHEPYRFHQLLPFIRPTHWSFMCFRQAFSSILDPSARQQLTNTLNREISIIRQLTFAGSTRRTYSCQLLLYLQFCSNLSISPVPISQHNLGRYVAFISSKLSFSSVSQYLNTVRLLHLDGGYANPLLDKWYISSILKGTFCGSVWPTQAYLSHRCWVWPLRSTTQCEMV